MAQTLEELKEQAESYQKLIPTVSGQAQQQLLGALEATQGRIAGLESPEPAPVEGPPILAPQEQPIAQAPIVSPTGQIVGDPRLRPAEEVQQEVQATSPETPRFEQENPQITPQQAEEQGIREVNLASLPSVQQPQQAAGMTPQMLTTTQTTIKPGVSLPKEIKDALGETPSALAELDKVKNNLDKIESERTGLLQQYQEAITGFQREELVRKQQNEALINDKLAKYDQEADDIAKQKIDSSNWWKNKTTGQKIGTTLAVVLGAIGQGLTGRDTNAAVDSINKEIERDVEDQIRNLNNKKDANKAYMKRIRNVVGDFNNDEARRYAAVNMMLTPLSKKLQGMQQTAQNEVQRMNIANLINGIEERKLNNKIKIAQLEQPQISKTILSKPTGGGAKSAKELREQTKFEQEQRALTVPGFKGKAFTPKEADELRSAIKNHNVMESTLNQLSKLDSTSLKDRAIASNYVNALIGSLRVDLVGPGALSEGDKAFLDEMLPNPTDLLQMNNMARLNAILQTMKTKIEKGGETAGLIATDPRFGAKSAGRKYAK